MPAELDTFNQYLQVFLPLQEMAYADFAAAYHDNVTDAHSFYEVVPREYDKQMYPLIKRSLNYLQASGIWDVTYDQLARKLDSISALAGHWTLRAETLLGMADDPDLESVGSDRVTKYVRDTTLVLEDKPPATTMSTKNEVTRYSRLLNTTGKGKYRMSLEKWLHTNRSDLGTGGTAQLTESEIAAAYQSGDGVLGMVQNDINYNMAMLLTALRLAGVGLWCPDEQEERKAAAILDNLRDADLSQSGAIKALTEVLLANPYNSEAYELMEKKLGNTSEVMAIKNTSECSCLKGIRHDPR